MKKFLLLLLFAAVPYDPSQVAPDSEHRLEKFQKVEMPFTMEDLSPRERQILELLAEGMRVKDIAERLALSPATVHTHVRNAIAKLEVDTRTGQLRSAGDTGSMPDGVIYKPCGNRRAAVCPACAEVYRADTYQLVLAGLQGGKGLTEMILAEEL